MRHPALLAAVLLAPLAMAGEPQRIEDVARIAGKNMCGRI